MPTATFTPDLTSQAYKRNPFPTYMRLLEQSPVTRCRLPLVGEVYLVASHASVNTLLKDQERFAHDPANAGRPQRAGIAWWMPRLVRVFTDHMLGTDEPDHRRLRKLVDKAFGRRGIEGMRPRIEAITDALLDRMAGKREADLVAEFARPLPLIVICELLGLPDRDRPKFVRWVEAMTQSPSVLGIVRALPALVRMSRYLRGQFEQRRRAPQNDLITALVEAEDAGDQFSEDELLSMVFLLLIAGHETTVHLLGSGSFALMRERDQLEKLQADPALVKGAVEELLRYTSPVELATVRYARHDLDLEGVSIARGKSILPVLGAANCDPKVFDNPISLDIERQPNNHVALGSGIHFCLGQQLARLEAQIAFDRLFSRFPELSLAIAPENTEWRSTLGLRGLTRLPVNLNAPSPPATGPQ